MSPLFAKPHVATGHKRLSLSVLGIAACAMLAAGCSRPAPTVRTHISGVLTIRAEVDSLRNFSEFDVVVYSNALGDPDTLAFATTDENGAFSMDVEVADRGVFPLAVSRLGTLLGVEEIVLAEGDSVTVRGAFPLDGRPLRIVSRENAAWSAWKNTKAAYSRAVLAVAQSDGYSDESMRQTVVQTSNILWSLRELYPGALGTIIGEAEAVMMLEGWQDSILVARLGEIRPDHPSMANILRAARRSVARLAGQDSAITMLRSFVGRVDPAMRPEIRSEIIVALLDSLDRTQALAETRALIRDEGDGDWGRWAGRAVYEIETLMPGMVAPPISAVDVEGRAITLESFRGNHVLVEFYRPGDERYRRDLDVRNQLLEALGGFRFEVLSISVEPDSALNEALLEGRDLGGIFSFAQDGLDGEAARAYNVGVLPTRILVDPEGRIIAKYSGAELQAIMSDLAVLSQEGVLARASD